MSEENQPIYEHHLYVVGMHCASCTILIEDVLREAEEVSRIDINLMTREAIIHSPLSDTYALMDRVNAFLVTTPYTISDSAPQENAHATPREWAQALCLLGVVMFGLLLLARMDVVQFITADRVTPSTAFGIGVVASLSSCLAVVGGLVLTLASSWSGQRHHTTLFALFHVGRVSGFIVLGALLGVLGQSILPSAQTRGFITLGVSLVMAMVAVNLLELSVFNRRFRPTLPRGLSRTLLHYTPREGALGAGFVGVLTFFLPCGFTQSMQLAALSAGSPARASLIMGSFALGTLPMLLLITYAPLRFNHSAYRGVVLKAAGLGILLLAALNTLNTLSALGYVPPVAIF